MGNETLYTTVASNITESTENVTVKNCTNAAILEFPSDGFNRTQRRHGWIILHIALACYCFWLLAIVCDDYFVPAMESMCFCKIFCYIKSGFIIHKAEVVIVREPKGNYFNLLEQHYLYILLYHNHYYNEGILDAMR